MINYKLIATQFGESLKYDTSINEINRVFLSLTDLTFEQYPNPSITSIRSKTIYSWVLVVGQSSMTDDQKVVLIKNAIDLLVKIEKIKLKLLSLLPRNSITQDSISVKSGGIDYINKERIQNIQDIKNSIFDFSKLLKLCEELNIAFSNKSYLSVITLTRIILDHIPPVFGYNDFSQVANNYGSKSFKDSMQNLNNSSRKIADACLHTMIRKKETIPNSTQVDFSNDLDVLLGEIIRIS
ncbi:MAG: hypothetical protein PHX34_05950 [Candidatus Shapirobacteria bacterium]|nr:hypothetical protein [Candidatus Shapirobacteria bacterium]